MNLMKYWFFAAFTIIAAIDTRAAECTYDSAKMLALNLHDFDQDMAGGWRGLGLGCERQMAELLDAYRRAHQSDFTHGEDLQLSWHEGQTLAISGDYNSAIPLLSKQLENPVSPTIGQAHATPNMQAYAAATIAFLRRDKPGLIAARRQLAAMPKPDWFDQMNAGKNFTWPMNLSVVDGLIGCFEKTYAQAYGSAECISAGKMVMSSGPPSGSK
jgi:hypothetical protein